MGAVILTGTAQLAQAQTAPEKKVKDQGEYDIYNQTLKDQPNPAALLKDLDTWAQKYPDSDWKDDRLYYYVTAYNGTNQPAKVLEIGSQLMGRDLKKVYTDPKAGPQQMLTILYLMSVNALKLPNATPDQLAAGEKAAKQLQEFVPIFFTAANKPAGATDAAWNGRPHHDGKGGEGHLDVHRDQARGGRHESLRHQQRREGMRDGGDGL